MGEPGAELPAHQAWRTELPELRPHGRVEESVTKGGFWHGIFWQPYTLGMDVDEGDRV